MYKHLSVDASDFPLLKLESDDRKIDVAVGCMLSRL